MRFTGLCAAGLLLAAAGAAELADTTAPGVNDPAIEYYNYLKRPLRDSVSELGRKLADGTASLRYEGQAGYLRSLLDALHVPVESQIAVFSKTSLQADRIEPANPRVIYFNDNVAVAWVRGGFLELASQDPEQGVVFHMLVEEQAAKPVFTRREDCVRCHISDVSLGVPGMMVRSRFTAVDGMPRLILGGFTTDHRSPFEERWGGWYVTGNAGLVRHLGNLLLAGDREPESAITPQTLHWKSFEGKFDTAGYLSPYSDIAALLVFNHQMHMMNLITRVGWQTRAALYARRPDLPVLLRGMAQEFVDYLLFVDEAPLPGPVGGTSGFTAKFAALGPADRQGRSLRQFDLAKRVFRYPCSYMIYSAAFDALPGEARAAIYQRMWEILAAKDQAARYRRLPLATRRAIAEILKDTKPGLPAYFLPEQIVH